MTSTGCHSAPTFNRRGRRTRPRRSVSTSTQDQRPAVAGLGPARFAREAADGLGQGTLGDGERGARVKDDDDGVVVLEATHVIAVATRATTTCWLAELRGLAHLGERDLPVRGALL